MKLYIPKLKDCLRLTAPLTVPLDGGRFSAPWHLADRIVHGDLPWDYVRAHAVTSFTLVEGTVLQFKRYFVSSHAQSDRVTVAIFAHPERHLTPKKSGGTANMRDLEFDLSLDLLNQIEYEKVET